MVSRHQVVSHCRWSRRTLTTEIVIQDLLCPNFLVVPTQESKEAEPDNDDGPELRLRSVGQDCTPRIKKIYVIILNRCIVPLAKSQVVIPTSADRAPSMGDIHYKSREAKKLYQSTFALSSLAPHRQRRVQSVRV
ncbi:hypothetical protein O988_07293 [Pseudogymnoascus sp. VKM F-3808]|nr:hypothetical protein O988_07293 [Pseudogymnoascus sp. VKM F-3808]